MNEVAMAAMIAQMAMIPAAIAPEASGSAFFLVFAAMSLGYWDFGKSGEIEGVAFGDLRG